LKIFGIASRNSKANPTHEDRPGIPIARPKDHRIFSFVIENEPEFILNAIIKLIIPNMRKIKGNRHKYLIFLIEMECFFFLRFV